MARKKDGSVASSESDGTGLTSGESTKKGFSLTIGRLINFCVAVVFLCVFIAAVIVVGTLVGVQDGVKKHPANKTLMASNHSCILYSKCENLDPEGQDQGKACIFLYDKNYECELVIAVHAIIFVVALAMLVIAVIRGILGYDIWLTSIIEVVILIVCLVFSFVVSVTISIGLAITCNAVKAHYSDSNCNHYVPYPKQNGTDDTQKGFSFYHRTNTAQAASWFAFIFLAVITLVYVARVVIYFRRLKQRRSDREVLTANDQLSGSLPPRPI